VAGFVRLRDRYDFIVLGGGHAGLQAALKAALLQYSVLVVDRGPKYSRSYYAPRLENIPGFPEAISGHKLLDLQIAALKPHAERVAYVTPATATAATRDADGFSVAFDWLKQPRTARARVLVLALGVVDRMPEIAGRIDDVFPWANQGIVDFCLVCDGHDMTDRSVGVLGHDAFAAHLALDLLHFAPRSVEILTHGRPLLDGVVEGTAAGLREELARAGIAHVETAIAGFDGIREKEFRVRFVDGTERRYDRGFSGLGWYDMHDAMPRSLGCRFDSEGFVQVDDEGRAIGDGGPIPGLYVVGDLKSGWNLIPEAWASAERAVLHAYAEYL